MVRHTKRGAMVETDKGYGTADIIAACRKLSVMPRATVSPVGTAFDGRTIRAAGRRSGTDLTEILMALCCAARTAGWM